MFMIVLWVEEGSYSVIKSSDIEKPRREFHEYECGEMVQAKFMKKQYPAKIIQKGDNQKDLNVEMGKIISKCNERFMSWIESDTNSSQGEIKKRKNSKEEKKAVTNKKTKQTKDENGGEKRAKIQDIIKLNEMSSFANVGIQEQDFEAVPDKNDSPTMPTPLANNHLSLRTPPKLQNTRRRTPIKNPRKLPSITMTLSSTPKSVQSEKQTPSETLGILNSTPKSVDSQKQTPSKTLSTLNSTPRRGQLETRTPRKTIGTPRNALTKTPSKPPGITCNIPSSESGLTHAVFSGLNTVNYNNTDFSHYGDPQSQCYGYNASYSFNQEFFQDNTSNWHNTQLHQEGSFCNELPTTNSITDYYSSLDVSQKRAVMGFLECLSNHFRTMDGLSSTQSSVPCTPSTVTSVASDIPPRQVVLLTDPENEERFASIKVNPTQLRGIESKAGTSKNPGTFLLNKVADLIFTKEELCSSKGVGSLNCNKMEALQEYLFLKCKKLNFEMVASDKLKTVMQNKICNARMALKMDKK